MNSRTILFSILAGLLLIPSIAISQWVQTGGPEGGQIVDLLANGKSVIAKRGNTLFTSTNEGVSWKSVVLTKKYLSLLFFKDQFLFALAEDTLMRSTDLGESWTRLPTIEEGYFASPTTDGKELYSVIAFKDTSKQAFYRSTDNGSSWTRFANIPTKRIPLFQVGSNYILAYRPDEGLFRTPLDAINWEKIDGGLPSDSEYCRRIVIKGDEAVIQLDAPYHSTDGGRHWQPLSIQDLFYVDNIILRDQDIILSGIDKIYRSTDGGKNWDVVNTTGEVFHVTPGDDNLLYGNKNGVVVSTDNGATWQKRMKGVVATTIYSLYPSGSSLFAAGTGVYRTSNAGEVWEDITPEGFETYFWFVKEIQGFLFVGGSLAYYSLNEGDTWNVAPIGSASDIVKTSNAITAAISGTGIYRSTDFGANWSADTIGLIGYAAHQTHHLAVIGNSIFLTTDNGVYISTNEGASWKLSNGNIQGITDAITVLGNNLFVASQDSLQHGYIYKSSDLGVTWSQTKLGLPDSLIPSSLYSTGNLVFLSTNNGLFVTEDQGGSWKEIDEGLSTTYTHSVAASNGELFVGIEGAGVWRRPLGQLKVNTVSVEQLELSQNCPNPFNPTTSIKWVLPEDSYVKLSLLDVMGRAISLITEGRYSKGEHQIVFDASALPSGTYFYTLQSGGSSVTRKMTVMK